MSFSVSCRGCGLEYSGRQAARAAGEPRRPALRAHARGTSLRFLRTARPRSTIRASTSATLAEPRLARGLLARVSRPLPRPADGRDLVDGARARRSTSRPSYALRFFDNHGMLGFRRHRWKTVVGGSREYVRAILERDRLADCIWLCAVRRRDTPDATASRSATAGGDVAPFRSGGDRHPRGRGARAPGRSDRGRAADPRRVPLHAQRDGAAHRRPPPADERAPPVHHGTSTSPTAARRSDEPTMTYYLNRLQRLERARALLRDAEPFRRDPRGERDRADRLSTTPSTRTRASRAQRELRRSTARATRCSAAPTTASASTRTGSCRASQRRQALGVDW